MGSIPEFINHYTSKLFGVRLITTSDFNEIFNALRELQKQQKRNHFKYLPSIMESSENLRRIYTLISPKKAKGFNKIRLGNVNDGGYICLDNFKAVKAALSLGISNDVSWDVDVASRGLKIYQYDHTVEAPPVSNENFIFHKIKIEANPGPGSESLKTILEKYRLVDPQSVILKMDIEGDEWDVISSASNETLSVFSQILCEFHNFDKLAEAGFSEKAISVLSRLREQFEVFHIHANNYAPLLLAPGCAPLPETLEISFCRKESIEFEEVDENFPGELDAPNNPLCEDYKFEFPRRLEL